MKFDQKFDNKFDEKFKDEMDLLSPSEEQLERIKKSVYERLERDKREKSVPELNEKPKKPLKIRIAAISGAACACAAALVIIVTGNRAGLMFPGMSQTNRIENSLKNEGSPIYGTNGYQGPTAAGPTGNFTDNTDYCCSIGFSAEDKTGSAAAGTEISGENTLPGGAPGSIPENAPQSTEAGSSNIPRLSFSDNNELCTVTLNGKTADYGRSEIYNSIEADKNELDTGELMYADSGLEEKLLVHFDEKHLYVFYESGELFGYYTAK